MNDLAMWLGYAVMACAGVALVALVLFVLSYASITIVNKWIKAMMRAYDLNTLRKTMRKLEAEGKVRKKEFQP
ncbi:hypothetical protein K3F44_10045 [Pseudomonas sp. S07E 245]|uniref:hypothetical protein n=1 Tax=Pseudomonas sp. S07E 245 TaxID=2866278 RepID=UPI001C73A062|nr:hypothetical protein [Pseudomonas sp. S07E 245]QYX54605.1 hypothetical protein K3F44_10045 [Pseudomonas sp. S07E 245]